MIFLCANKASAISYIWPSVPVYLNMFTACRTKRQFSCAYPNSGTILSMLGENSFPLDPGSPNTKGMFVSSHRPVQRFSAHSIVRLKGVLNFFERAFAASTSFFHGLWVRSRWIRIALPSFARERFDACH